MTDCKHENFAALVNVIRLHPDNESENITGYSAEITIKCNQCKQLFEFVGVDVGYRHDRPMANIEFTTLNAPIIPSKGEFRIPEKMSYSINPDKKDALQIQPE